MGEACSQPEMDMSPQHQLRRVHSPIPMSPLEEMDENREMTQSQGLQNRTTFAKNRN